MSFDRVSREKRLGEEALLNRRESRAALVFAGLWLFLIPFGFGFFVSRGLAEPIITFTQVHNPSTSALHPLTRLLYLASQTIVTAYLKYL